MSRMSLHVMHAIVLYSAYSSRAYLRGAHCRAISLFGRLYCVPLLVSSSFPPPNYMRPSSRILAALERPIHAPFLGRIRVLVRFKLPIYNISRNWFTAFHYVWYRRGLSALTPCCTHGGNPRPADLKSTLCKKAFALISVLQRPKPTKLCTHVRTRVHVHAVRTQVLDVFTCSKFKSISKLNMHSTYLLVSVGAEVPCACAAGRRTRTGLCWTRTSSLAASVVQATGGLY